MTDGPKCQSWTGYYCIDSSSHEGWRHANTWDEVEVALDSNREVWDRDGDKVVRIGEDFGVARNIFYQGGAVDDAGTLPSYECSPDYILLSDCVPVTNQEMDEVLASIAKASDSEH